MHRALLVAALALAACGGGAPATSTTSSASGSPPTGASPPPALDTRQLGQPCGEGDACAAGSCVTFYGIAGPRGPAFKSCEISCADKAACPDGTTCITIADGPGQVCRPPG